MALVSSLINSKVHRDIYNSFFKDKDPRHEAPTIITNQAWEGPVYESWGTAVVEVELAHNCLKQSYYLLKHVFGCQVTQTTGCRCVATALCHL